jgi:hypothetical protein
VAWPGKGTAYAAVLTAGAVPHTPVLVVAVKLFRPWWCREHGLHAPIRKFLSHVADGTPTVSKTV